MRSIEIDLAEPFEKVVATVLSLPAGCSDVVRDRLADEADLKLVIRGLYEAANGRHVETKIGMVAIAPPAFDFLKAKPFRVATRTELLIEVAARLIAGSEIADGPEEMVEAANDESGFKTSTHYRPIHRAPVPLVLNPG